MPDYPREVEEAADLLVFYFRASLAGPSFSADNETEIRDIVYKLYDAATAHVARRNR